VIRPPYASTALHFTAEEFFGITIQAGTSRHAAAQATARPCVVLHLPGIAVDVDNPADLRLLASLAGDTRAQRLARRWAVADFPIAANE
jgi:2-phospho-L-lactate guanylyltransferase (CobY/MobA/RfbA family)